DNGTGKITSISYTSAITDRVSDRNQGHEWAFKLPIALNVVDKIEIFDGLNTYSTLFNYHDGYYDAEEKEFRGFAFAEKQARGDSTAPSLLSAYQYNTGAEQKALKGKPLQMEARNIAGDVFYRETFSWETKKLAAGTGGDERVVTFPFQAHRIKNVLEKNQGTPVQLQWDYQYDDYGNMTQQIEHGRLDNGWNDERATKTVFSSDTNRASGLSHWLLNKPIEQTTEDENGTLIAKKRYYYDASDTLGNIGKGNITKEEQWVSGGDYITSVRNDYDSFGNITAIYDPLYTQDSDGHYREIVYDTNYKTFPVQEKIHVDSDTSLSLSAEYDAGFGVVTGSTDFNGYKTDYAYDTFGRIISTTKPLDSKPTQEYNYILAQDIGNGKTINYVETRQRESNGGDTIDSRKFFDGLGRHVMTRSEGEQAGQVVVSDTVQFNARKTAHKKYLPYFENIDTGQQGLLAYVAPTFEQNFTEHFYDALGREIKMLQPDGSNSQITYAPLQRTVKDEEQTRSAGSHAEAAMRYEEDGLQDKDGN
ncbi:MAG: hypothetical protein KAJ95_02875, partial [Gammaproteobacteria bacterium]|nr:hypothetical protein [Gammaproteobacteria bacterium]